MKWKLFKWTSILVAAAMFINLTTGVAPRASASGGDEYDELRANLYDVITGGDDYDPEDPDIEPRIASLDARAGSFWTSMDKSAGRTYLWSELASPLGSGMVSNHVSGSYGRLQDMAIAYSTKGSAYYGNAELLADVISGMDWMYANRYNTSVPKRGYDNWYDWQISSPLAINNITILFYSHLTARQIADWHAVLDWQALALTASNVGANRVWSCNILITSGIVTKNSAKIGLGVDALSPVFEYVQTGEGFYKDGSFLQHTALIAYNGGYGVSLIDNLTKVMAIVAGSSWDFTDPNLRNIYEWIYDAYEPLFYDNGMMAFVNGRNIARIANDNKGVTTVGALGSAVLRLAYSAPDPADAARYKSMVKQWMSEATHPTPYDSLGSIQLVAQMKAIMDDASIQPRGDLVLNKQYPNMARAVHRRPDFAFGISMYSDKIGNYELINGENLKGWHTGAGMTYLYNDDIAQYQDSFWPTVDSHRLPGTTVVQNSETPPHLKNGSNWVGGTDVGGLYGVTGMHYVDSHSSLSARKSWFMFDDEIVALGADIKSTNGSAPVETIVDNRKLNEAGTNALTVDGAAKSSAIGWSESMTGVTWAHLEGNVPGSDVGYYFPGGGADLSGLRESRTANWNSINNYFNDINKDPIYFDDHTRHYAHLRFDHGTAPSDGSYAYVLLPGKSAAQTGSYSNAPDIEVLENSAEAQAVRETNLGATGINFWQDAAKTVAGVTSNKKASVMLRTDAAGTEISAADPTMANKGTIELTLDMELGPLAYVDPGVIVGTSGDATTLSINVNGAGGQSFKIRFGSPGAPYAGPEAPTGLAASGNTERSVTLSWNAVDGADDYRLYRAEASTGQYVSIRELPAGATSFTDTGLAGGTNYLYKAAAVDADGISPESDVLSTWTVPAPPGGLRVTGVTEAGISLSWQAASGASGYMVYRSESRNGPFAPLHVSPIAAASYTDSDIISGINYYYRVEAANAGGASQPSAAIPSLFGLPAYLFNESFDDLEAGDLNGQNGWLGLDGGNPVNTVVVQAKDDSSTDRHVKLSTKVASGTASAERLFTAPQGSTLIVEVTAVPDDRYWKNALVLADSALSSGSIAAHVVMENGKMWGYNGGTKTDILPVIEVGVPYRIKTVVHTSTRKYDVYVNDELRVSGWSYRYAGIGQPDKFIVGNSGNLNSYMSFDDAKTSYMPLAPGGLQAAPLSGDSISLSWNAAPGAAGYRLYRSSDPSAGFERIGGAADLTGTSYTDEGLSPGTVYYYKIAASHGEAVSPESVTVSTTTASDSAVSAVPAYVIDENFDGMTNGNLNGQNGWIGDNGGVSANTITVQDSGGADGGKQVAIVTGATTGKAEAYALFEAPQGSILTTEATLTTTNNNWKNALILADNSMASNSSAVHIVMQNGKIWGYNGGTQTDILASAPNGTAYRLKVVVNTETRKFDVYVGDELKASQWNYRYAGVGKIDRVSSSISGNASSISLDDVRVSYMPLAPGNVQATALSSSSIGLTWSAVPGAAGYRVYRSSGDGYERVGPANLDGLSYTDEGLASSTTYNYKVVAVHGGAVSPESAVATATTEAGAAPEPEAPAATLSGPSSAVLGQPIELAVGIEETAADGSAIVETVVHYDSAKLAFASSANADGQLELDAEAIALLRDGFQVLASGVKPQEGEILVVLARTSAEAGIAAGGLFQLRGTVAADASAGNTGVYVSKLHVSSDGELIEANTGQASITLQVKLADVSALEAAIATAEGLLAAASPGSQPGQYPPGAVQAFAVAIAAAEAAAQDESLTQEGASAALGTLQTAISVFRSSVISPPATDKTALAAALQKARAKLGSAASGDKIGQYPGGAIDDLAAAIGAAQSVQDSSSATQGQIDNARTVLDGAMETFATRIVTLVPGQTAVTIRDLSLIAKYYGTTDDDADWSFVEKADLFGNGEISLVELAAVARMIVADWLAE